MTLYDTQGLTARFYPDYERIEQAIEYIESHFRSQPGLEEIAQSVHLSKFHFDRMFKQWVGISPIQFQQYMTLDYTKQKLRESRNLLDTALDAGLSGPGRLHDLFVTFEAMTPGEFKKQGQGLEIDYGFSPSPFGECLTASTRRGICFLGFTGPQTRDDIISQMFSTWPGAIFKEDPLSANALTKKIFPVQGPSTPGPFHLHLKGTNFQINVWKALLNIPEGWITSYRDIASYIGQPKAFRAVAGAIARNPVAYLIPCHRVISRSGKIPHYRWGAPKKKAMVGWEAARTA